MRNVTEISGEIYSGKKLKEFQQNPKGTPLGLSLKPDSILTISFFGN